ncbi:MAG TPA: SseB family protein [Gammaproteobacteria bacterium]|nr:SseB family protein [Gammaproteobacteria bacterium]
MENATSKPASLLEALLRFEDNVEGRKLVLEKFIMARVYVLLDRPWDGRSLPNTETKLLYVSDGENKEQAMLAVFTGRAEAETASPDMGEFKHPVEVDAPWALLSLVPNAGVRINPNAEPSFRILPELAVEMRKIAEHRLAQIRQSRSGTGPK